MSIKLFTGIPGCGKSYYCMKALLNEDVLKKYFVVQNIVGFKGALFPDWAFIRSFDDVAGGKFDPAVVFEKDFQDALAGRVREMYGRSVLWVIDECQNYFRVANDNVLKWLSYHRHLGQDIWLVTQSRVNLWRPISDLVEVEIRGVRGAVFSSFIYKHMVGNESFRTERVKKDKAVFAAYQSFDHAGVKKKRSKLVMGGIGLAAVSVAAFAFSLFYVVPRSFSKANKSVKATNEQYVQRSGHAKQVKAKPSTVERAARSGSRGISSPGEYRLAGTVGDEVMLQNRQGYLVPMTEAYPGYSVMRSESSSITLLNRLTGDVLRLDSRLFMRSEAARGVDVERDSPEPHVVTFGKMPGT